MKDTIITAQRKRKEIKIYLICISIAFSLNIFAIIFYKTNWSELFTQWHVVLLLSVIIYIFSVLIRILYFLIKKTIIFSFKKQQ